MNGAGTRRAPSLVDYNSTHSSGSKFRPDAKILVNGYNESLGDIDGDKSSQSHYNQVKGPYARSSDLLDPNDPVAMHLLMETAIGDSQQFGILSFEEAEKLKKEITVANTRIEATKRKLAIELKIRDASTSLNRLHSTGSRDSIADASAKSSVKRHRRSVMSRSSGSDLLNKTDDELAASVKKCEDLAQELWGLEKGLQEMQRRLLEHTAGVLQMTHKGFLENDILVNQMNGVNGHSNENHDLSIFDVAGNFNDSSFYRNLDTILEIGDTRGNNQVAAAFEQQTQNILSIERKIRDLNKRLRESIAQASSGRQILPLPPDYDSTDEQSSEEALQSQILYLEKGFETMQRSQVETLQTYKQSAYTTEERLEDLNNQLHSLILRCMKDANPQYPLPPNVSGKNPEEQMAFLEGGLDVLEQRIQDLKDDSQNTVSKSLAHEQRAGQYEGTVQSLWQNLLSEEEKWRQQDQGTDNRAVTPTENYSLESFAAKVQSLHTRSAHLQEQKDILGRQIQQQRELNSQSDNQKDARLADVTTELDQTRRALEVTHDEHASKIDALTTQLDASGEAKAQILAELQNKQHEITNLETRLQNVVAGQEEQAARSNSQEEVISIKTAEAEKAKQELENFEGEMVRLQTELTVARAELDGAYGTRAQRAAEVASHPALLQEISDLRERNTTLESASLGNTELNQRVQTLQKELSETIGEYEIMTKSSIEYEKERENLENSIDSLRDCCEALETQLSDEKVKWLGVKSPGPPGSRESMGASSTSTSVLKNEFKKMMRETRSENMKALRFEQNERRKLEAQLRAVIREQTPGKSSLSQSMTAQ